jgi:hypothetical protein
MHAGHVESAASIEAARELVYRYHRQAINQSALLFWLSVIAAVAGFALILYTTANFLLVSPPELTVRAIPGCVFECLAGFFFRQSARVRQRATELFDRLRFDQERFSAIALAESIEDPIVRDLVKAQTVFQLLDTRSRACPARRSDI